MKPKFKKVRLPGTRQKQLGDGKELPERSKPLIDSIIKEYEAKAPKNSRILGLSDATGSMLSIWDETRAHITEMIRRIAELGKFQMKWVAYRDYCDGADVLKASGWHNSLGPLLDFVKTIDCFGGGANDGEAVEHALAHAVKEKNVTRILLIGDEPPHAERDYKRQAARLAEQKRPVYSFVVPYDDSGVDPRTERMFEEISTITGGASTILTKAQDILDVIVMNAADDIGGEEMVEQYIEKYRAQIPVRIRREYKQKLLQAGRK